MKWVVYISEFDMLFKTITVIKGQVVANFSTEFAHIPEMEEEMELVEPLTWNPFVDGSSGEIVMGQECSCSTQKNISLITI